MLRIASLLATLLAVQLLMSPASFAASELDASIDPVSCSSGGTRAVMTNASTEAAEFVVERDGVLVDTVAVSARSTGTTKFVPVSKAAETQVTVRIPGTGYVSSIVSSVDCATWPSATATAAARNARAAGALGALPFTGLPAIGVIGICGAALVLSGLLLLLGHGNLLRNGAGDRA